MKAQELNGTHLGKTVTAKIGHATITDVLTGVDHKADLISDGIFSAEYSSWSIGRPRITLEFKRAGTVTADELCTVEFRDGND